MRDRSMAGWKAKSKFSSVCPIGIFAVFVTYFLGLHRHRLCPAQSTHNLSNFNVITPPEIT
jgi:hypothetical protein